MGLFFTLLYIFTTYVTPTVLFGPLAEYRVELIVIVLALLCSVPRFSGSELGKARETWALLGLTVAVVLSFWGQGLFGLSVGGITDFLTQALVYPLVLVNCRTRTHMQAVVGTVAMACGFTILRGSMDLYSGTIPSPYVFVQSYGTSDAAYRLMGLGPINDPNDFGQLMAFTMPAMFLFWRKGKLLLNVVRVLLPAGLLFYGIFETHSRGAMVALLVVLIVTLRRKIGLIPSLVMAAGGFVAAVAIGWGGGAGREVTVDQGADRLEAWSTGLELIKHNPLFGVGYKRFTEYFIITAHNTVVVCAAELGLIGLFCWIVFTLGTVRDLVVTTGKPRKKKRYDDDEVAAADEGMPVSAHARLAYPGVGTAALRDERRRVEQEQPWQRHGTAVHEERFEGPGRLPTGEESPWAPVGTLAANGKGLPPEEISRIASVLTGGISGYLAAGWFLSRAYVMALFLAGALAQVVYRMALQEGIGVERMRWSKLLRSSLLTAIGLLLFVYLGLIVQHKMR